MGRACPLCPGISDINLFRYCQSVIDLDQVTGKRPGEFLFTGHRGPTRCMTTRQYARLVSEWIGSVGLDPRRFESLLPGIESSVLIDLSRVWFQAHEELIARGGNFMKVVFAALALTIALGTSSHALQPAPLASTSDVTQVAGGCGVGFHRGPFGGCRQNYSIPAAHACPRGFHIGPGGQCRGNGR